MLAKLVQAYHLKLFFSNNLIKAEILNKIKQDCVVSACSNNKWIIKRLQEEGGPYANKNDERAAAVVADVLATKALRKQVSNVYWDGVISQNTQKKNHKQKAERFWDALIASGLSVTRKPVDPPKKLKGPQPRKQPEPLKGTGIPKRFRDQMWKLLTRKDGSPRWTEGRRRPGALRKAVDPTEENGI